MSFYYRFVIIETYMAHGEQSHHSVRARPLPGQGLSTSMRVECSASMRERNPVPTNFKVWAKIKDSEREPHLYTSWQWEYKVVSDAEAKAFIQSKQWGTRT